MKASSIETVSLMNTAVSERVSKLNNTKESSFSDIMNNLSEITPESEETLNSKVKEKWKNSDLTDSQVQDSSTTDEKQVDSLKTKNICEEKLDSKDKIKEFSDKIKDVLLSVLDISEEDLESAMELLGINYLDCLDKNNLAQLLTKLTGNTDISVLITDETLYQQFSDITTVIDGLTEDILADLGITEEEFTTLLQQLKPASASIKDTSVETQAQNQVVDTKPKEAISTNVDDTKELMLNVSNSISGESGKVNTDSAQTKNGSNQQFSEQSDDMADLTDVEDNVNDTVQRFVPRQETIINNQEEPVVINEKTTVDTESILKQIQNQLRISTSLDNTKMEFQLNPENLGKLTIQLASKDGIITAQITTQNNVVKEVIESQIVLLRENMNNQGLKVEAVEVTVESHEFERNLEQGNSNNNQEQYEQQQKKTRRLINFNDPESLEDLSEEETLIANMMIDNGNSLNYTV